MENLLWGVSSCTFDGDVKDMDFVNVGRRLSTKKPDSGLLVGLSGDSEESVSSIANEKRLSDMMLTVSKWQNSG